MVLFNPKTPTLYKRGDDFKVNGQFTLNEFSQINKWLVTKKMDGASVILSISDQGCAGYGRTAKSQFNQEQSTFIQDALVMATSSLSRHGVYNADIYAELVGPGVQSNKHGFDELQLHVFDVRIGGYWLDFDDVVDIADKSGILVVQKYAMMTIANIEDLVSDKMPSWNSYSEGIVARTDPYLYNKLGNRIMFKLKVTDY